MTTTALLIAVQSIVKAVRAEDAAAYEDAMCEAYDLALEAGAGDIEEAIEALPMSDEVDFTPALAQAVDAIEQDLATR